ncbi:MAG: nuclear transport factor 2 family protein [Bacteroidia bacterium]|nr:nuclear transport factor 2 family protein [Bacteroidia bacterium]
MKYSILFFAITFLGCTHSNKNQSESYQIETIDQLISNWHQSAANANLDEYMNLMDSSFIYVGTDATEKWSKKEFALFCKPYFDKKKTWDFKSLDRTINISSNQNTAWFYEILETHMGTCRGSGILKLYNQQWKLNQYVLSLAIPNEDMNKVKQVIHSNDSIFQQNYKLQE